MWLMRVVGGCQCSGKQRLHDKLRRFDGPKWKTNVLNELVVQRENNRPQEEHLDYDHNHCPNGCQVKGC